MPKPPNLKSNRIVLEGNIEEENIRIRAFKEICQRNNIPYREEILKRIDHFLREHNWPPGNSQTQLAKFVEKRLVEKACEYPGCTDVAKYLCYPHPPGKNKVFYCMAHHKHALENQLLKKSKPL